MKSRKIGSIAALFAWLVLPSHLATAQTWTLLVTTGSPPAGGSVANYDAPNNRLIQFFPILPSNEVWVLTNANGLGGTPVWTQLQTIGTPPSSTTFASVVYAAPTNQLIVYGGCGGTCSPPLSGVYVLSNANGLGGTPAWSQSTTNPPEARDHQSAVYNSSHNTMIAFGGSFAFFGTDQNDTRILSPANASTSNWTTLTTSGGPPGVREGQTAIYDQTHNRMTIFGGGDAVQTCCPYEIDDYNDTWVLSSADGQGGTPTWTQLAPSDTPPSPRQDQSAVYDPAHNRMYVFGGSEFSNATQTTTELGDVWVLSHANGVGGTPTWMQIGQYGTPPGALVGHGAAFDFVNQRMIVSGGGGQNQVAQNGVFVLDLLHR